MRLLAPPPPPPWEALSLDWAAALTRLRAVRGRGLLQAAALTPLAEHFDRAWQQLVHLSRVATEFAPRAGAQRLPIHHLAEFVLDDLLDVFRGAASEVVLLVPDDSRPTGDPSPRDILDEAERFVRYLEVAGMAARADADDPLAAALVRATDALAGWIVELAPMIDPVEEILEAINYGAAEGFGVFPHDELAN